MRRIGLSFAGPGEIESREVELDPQENPEEIKSREVVLDAQESPGRDQEEGVGAGLSRKPEEIKRREVELDPQESPGRDQEQGGGAGLRKLDYPLLQLFLNSSATDIVLVTLLRTADETAISGVH